MGWPKGTAGPAGRAEVEALFRMRNALMHQGAGHPEAIEAIETLLPAISRFVLTADETLQSASKERPWLKAGKAALTRHKLGARFGLSA